MRMGYSINISKRITNIGDKMNSDISSNELDNFNNFENTGKKIIEWRRILHKNPELSFKEYKTTEFIKEKLLEFGNIEILQVAKTGVIGVLKGAQPGKIIAFRADIDALPLEEKTECEFKSEISGVMHACGHDIHTSILLGLASLLSKEQKNIHGEVKFIFQRGEEIAPGGAKEITESGILKDMEMIFALHVMPGQKSGTIGIKRGIATANKDSFEIQIKGRGGHSSMPQQNIDPIVAAAEIVTSLQSIVSRNLSPFETAVLSVVSFNSGEEYGVVPDEAKLTGAVRTFSEETREIVKNRMKAVVDNISKAYGAVGILKFPEWDYRAVYNDEKVCDIAEKSVVKALGKDMLLIKELPESFSEDFSEYMKVSRGCMVWLGIDNEDAKDNHKLHSPYFNPDEKAFINGLQYFYYLCREIIMDQV